MVPEEFAGQADEAGWLLIDYGTSKTFPEEFSRIQDPGKRKQVLIDLLLPLVLKANEDILAQRQELQRIKKSGGFLTPGDRKLVMDLADTYQVRKESDGDTIDELLVRVDVLPVSLVLAQAAIESGWGTSRFALEGNNLFGLRGSRGLGMVPGERHPSCGVTVATFMDLQECIDYYMWNINTRSEYEGLRKIRTQEHIRYDPLVLAQGLDSYSEMGNAYVHKVVGMITENRLVEYDAYRLRRLSDQRTARIPSKSFKPAGIS